MEKKYPERRDLDGIYFRVERDGRPVNVCLSDLTPEERGEVMEGRTHEWMNECVNELCGYLRRLSEAAHVVGEGAVLEEDEPESE